MSTGKNINKAGNIMCYFKKEDVLIVAKAILLEPLRHMNGDYTPYYFCIYCDSELKGYHVLEKDFIHDNQCPVLVAQDLITIQK